MEQTKVDDGGPAFPASLEKHESFIDGDQYYAHEHPGMSLRDWFAGQALSNPATHANNPINTSPKEAATWAYEVADAMLKARGGA